MKKEVTTDEIHQIIKAKLSSLKYSDRFYDWKTCPLLCEKISDLLELIRIGVKDPYEGVALIIQFLKLDKYILESCDDSDGGVGYEFNGHAIDVLIPFAKEYKDKDKLTETVYELINDDDYGCHSGVLERIGEILPEDKIRELLNRKFNKQYSNDYIYQELAYALNDAPLLISLLESKEYGFRDDDYRRIAKCYLESGNVDEALKWTLKISETSYGQEELLEKIYKRKGDTDSLKELYEESYLRFPTKETEKQLIALCGKAEFQKIKDKKIDAIKNSSIFSDGDMEYLLDQKLIDDAEEYLYIRRNKVDGVYLSSTFIKKVKKYCSPLSQTIICRVPLNYYLNKAKSKYYYYAAQYLKHLIKISDLVDAWKDVQCHEEYYSELCQKHYRKKAFWFYFK